MRTSICSSSPPPATPLESLEFVNQLLAALGLGLEREPLVARGVPEVDRQLLVLTAQLVTPSRGLHAAHDDRVGTGIGDLHLDMFPILRVEQPCLLQHRRIP